MVRRIEMRLATIEDFEKATKALQDPTSTPQQYVIENSSHFGYCTFCRDITTYKHEGYKFEQTDECQKCHRRFGTGMHDLPHSHYIKDPAEMPTSMARKLEEVGAVTREDQKKRLIERLKQFIRTQEHLVTEAKRSCRSSAKNVGRGHKLLASYA